MRRRAVLQFFAVDGGGESKDKSLNRSEFLTCLVRLSVMKYVMPGIHSARKARSHAHAHKQLALLE